MTRLDRRWMFALATAALLLAVGDIAFGSCSGLLHLAPFALLVIALLRGRYLGERYLTAAARRSRSRRLVVTRAVHARAGHEQVVRGSALLGSGLARRPPPISAPA